ncbi:MAG: HD domain-containing protein [Eubacterium sp.]
MLKECLRKCGMSTEAHCLRTGVMMEAILVTLEQEAGKELFSRAALRAFSYHDIGKAMIPENILNKAGPLDGGEQHMMRKHGYFGASLFKAFAKSDLKTTDNHCFYQTGFEICAYHHEWWDGSGYPEHKKGKDIPLAARICAVADAWDAMTHGRPYRPLLDYDRALEEIQQGSGTQFDPEIVAVFLSNEQIIHQQYAS